MKTLLAIVLLASCEGSPHKTTIANAGGTAHVVTVPAGWVAIPPPDDERLHCANYADDTWQVAIDHDAVTFTEAKQREADTGPPLPFTPKSPLPQRGRQHVLVVSDGFLVGYDAGEWGGALYWYSKDGTTATQLDDKNVHGLVAFGPDLVASIEGLAHMMTSEGNVRWIEHASALQWRSGAQTPLAAAPRTFVATPDAIFVLTTESLQRVGTDRKAVVIQPMRTGLLYPDSMAIGSSRELWIGMRQFVIRMTPHGTRFDEAWFVRESCVRATTHNLECVCSALGSAT